MRLNVVLTDEQNEAITERAAAEGIPRAELIRQAISSYLEPPEPAPCRDELPMSRPGADEIAVLEEKIRNLSTVAEERDRAIEARDRGIIEAGRLRDQILVERAQRIEDLKTSANKLVEQGERYQVLLQGAQQAALPEKAGTGRRPWWKFWGE